jgi:hypothetical protein
MYDDITDDGRSGQPEQDVHFEPGIHVPGRTTARTSQRETAGQNAQKTALERVTQPPAGFLAGDRFRLAGYGLAELLPWRDQKWPDDTDDDPEYPDALSLAELGPHDDVVIATRAGRRVLTVLDLALRFADTDTKGSAGPVPSARTAARWRRKTPHVRWDLAVGGYISKCDQCGELFTAKRSDAAVCSSRCQKRAQRKRRRT